MKMTLDMCVKRAGELKMSYGSYMASREHIEDAYEYGAKLENDARRKGKSSRCYPGLTKLSVPEQWAILTALREKARIHNISVSNCDISQMSRSELKSQINKIWCSL